MDTTEGLKEKPRFASPIARGGQNEGERMNQVQKEEMIKKTKQRAEKEGAEGERESFHASGQKEFKTGEVLECSEKSEIDKGNRSARVEPKQRKISKSERKNLYAKEMKGGKFTKAKRTLKCVASEESIDAEDAESGVVQGDGGGVAEWWEEEDDAESGVVQGDGWGVAEWWEQEDDAGKLLEEKKPMLSGGAKSSTSVGRKSKTKKKHWGVEVQVEEGIMKNKSKTMRAEGKGGDKETQGANSMDSKQKASQGATTGLEKSREQSVIKSKALQPISSLLTDSQYNKIFESVLDSSLEHCLEDARAVLSEVELLQASIGECSESSAIGGNEEGELESSQSGRSSRDTGQGKKRKLQENSVDKTSGKQTKEYEQEPKKSYCNEDEYDLWAQCSLNNCMKWRKLKWHEDLSVLPADWVCSQNTDPQHSSCDCPEENWSGSEEDLVHSSLVPGSMVWAHQPGFSWWPAMIDFDPEYKSSFLFKNKKDKSPSRYHVTYFGEPVTRAWVSASRVQAFHALSEVDALSTVSQQSYKMFSESLYMSRQAEKLPLKRRLEKFGFLSRYKNSKISAMDDNTESSEEEYSFDEKDFAGTCKKRCEKRAKPEATKKAAKLPSNQKQNGRNGPKLKKNKELGKKEKGREEKKKAVSALFSGPMKKKAPSKPESVGEADSCGKELEAGGERAEKKVLTPSFTKPKENKTREKQALHVEKPLLKVREQTVPGITAPRGQAGREAERGSESTGEDRKARKINGKEKGLKRHVEKEGSGAERKRKIPQEVKRKESVTVEDRRGSATEGEMIEDSEGEELEEESMKKTEKSVASEDLTGFLEDDMEILNCQQEFLKDVSTEEEEDGEEFSVMLLKGVRATYLPA